MVGGSGWETVPYVIDPRNDDENLIRGVFARELVFPTENIAYSCELSFCFLLPFFLSLSYTAASVHFM